MNHNFPGSDQETTTPQIPEATGDSKAAATGAAWGGTDREGLLPLSHQGYLVRLAARIEQMEVQLERLLAEVASSGSQVASLTRHLTDLDATRAIEERLVELVTRLESSQEQLHELTETVARSGRSQFKANTLAETKEQRIEAVLATLQEIVTRREELREAREIEGQQRLTEVRMEARGELAADLLPVLDGLELALESGYTLAEKRRQQENEAALTSSAAPAPTRGVWQRLRYTLAGRPPAAVETPMPATAVDDMVNALAAWLQGLELVRERFSRLLAAAEIEVIPAAQGQTFDPHQHVAVETELRADMVSNTVIRVLRKGYRQRHRVLRHAEVVVNRVPAELVEVTGDIDERTREDHRD